MPKKKRKTTEGPDSQGQEMGEEELRRLPNAKMKRSFEDAFIVISDSEGELESKEENGLHKKRTKQQLDRSKFAAKRKIAQMTEDEQFELALKMSEQEARQVNCQEEEEEELLRKAIAESLNSCHPPDSSAAATVPPLAEAPGSPKQSCPAKQEDSECLPGPLPCPDSPHSACNSHSPSTKADGSGQSDVTKGPLVVLRRLSQEIVESSLISSIIVSPLKSQSLTKSNEKPSSPANSDSSDSSPIAPGESQITLSPTFPRVASSTFQLAPRRLFTGACSPSETTGMEPGKELQSCAEPMPPAGSPATLESVSHKHRILGHYSSLRRSCGAARTEDGQQLGHSEEGLVSAEHVERAEAPENAPQLCTLNKTQENCKQDEDRDTVHYYWGIPFCPKGVDPNQYTKVILCQLEVYQKSLKQAQRQLLQKKEFGDPVVPNSSSLSQSDCRRGEQANKENGVTEELEDGESDERKEPESAAWLLPPKNRDPEGDPGENWDEGKNSECEDEATTSSCQQASKVQFAEDMPEEGEPMQITQSISALTPLDSKRSPDIATESQAEEEITVCPETQPSPSEAIEPEREEICSPSKDAMLQDGGDEDAGKRISAHSPPADDPVSCPLCGHSFPASKIELHAMYCSDIRGEDAIEDMPVLTRRQREAKGKAACSRGTSEPVADTDKYEKCYLCKSLVPLKEYQRHVDSCLLTAREAQGSRRLRSAKEVGRREGRLLSMLELSEHNPAGADDGETLPLGGEDPRHCISGMDVEASCSWGDRNPHVALADSPIKSFVSISEATDCLVDFKQQLAFGSGSRQQTKAGRRGRRKLGGSGSKEGTSTDPCFLGLMASTTHAAPFARLTGYCLISSNICRTAPSCCLLHNESLST
uniref:BRCA1-A complex subunit RAP80 n=1 Tax=Sphenodon punctatus TaxID=8508 RepID=A0A8D0GNE9_SPHPU